MSMMKKHARRKARKPTKVEQLTADLGKAQQAHYRAVQEFDHFKSMLRECQTILHRDTSNGFLEYGILPHGKPLFGDGSTMCARCQCVAWYRDLVGGLCANCHDALKPTKPPVKRLTVGR